MMEINSWEEICYVSHCNEGILFCEFLRMLLEFLISNVRIKHKEVLIVRNKSVREYNLGIRR